MSWDRGAQPGAGPIGIICGGGSLPIAVADSVVRRGRQVVLFPIRGWADADAIRHYPHHWVTIGHLGRFFHLAAAEHCRDLVFIGTLVRPSLRQIRLDWRTLLMLPQIAPLFRGGDNHLLSGFGRLLEERGFNLIGAHEIAPEILVAPGPLGHLEPSARDAADISTGLDLIRTIGRFDIGQAAVVAENRIVAVEAAEGTDNMLARVAELRRQGRVRLPVGVGVLVKAVKPRQDRRFDLPAIGPQTVHGVARAGLAGLAVVAGEAVIAEPHLVAVAADSAKLFVVGVRAESAS